MSRVLHGELYRALTIRSGWISLAAITVSGLLFGLLNRGLWAILVGVGTFAAAVVGTSSHFQHRTAVLLFLGQPRRLGVLAAQAIAYAVIALVIAAVTGVAVMLGRGASAYPATLVAAATLAVFGVACATIVRRALWVFIGVAVWVIFVEGLLGKLRQPLPFSLYLLGSGGDWRSLLFLGGWAVLALCGAAAAVFRDVTGD
jgi:hypothetical protein